MLKSARMADLSQTDTFSSTPAAQQNVSNPYHDHFNPGTPFDIAMDCLLIFALITSLYLLIVLCYYEWHLYTVGKSEGKLGGKFECRIGPWLRILCILSAFFTLLRCINDIAYYKASTVSSIPCTILKNMGVSWLIEVDTTVYLFLWLRQRVLYKKRSMRRLENPITSFASWLALLLIVAIFVVMNAVLLHWRNYVYDPVGAKCSEIKKPVNSVIPKLWLGSSTILHIVLVALYVYPLLRQTSKLNKRRQSRAPSVALSSEIQGSAKMLSKEPTAPSSGKSSLMEVVIRCVVISLICVITDGLTVAISNYWINESYQTKLRHSIYNINLIINVVAIVTSFKKWKIILFPCVLIRHPDRNGDREFGSTRREFASSSSSALNACSVNRVSA